MNFKSSTFAPHVIQDALYLVERRRCTIKVANNEIFMELSSLLENKSGMKTRGRPFSAMVRGASLERDLSPCTLSCSTRFGGELGFDGGGGIGDGLVGI